MKTISTFTGEYSFLSNFATSPITYGGVIYQTNEHFFQAMKTKDQKEREMVAAQSTPGLSKRAGRRIHLREDWEQIKDDVMLHGLRLKFQHPHLRDKLIATGNAILIEGNTWGDTYWGICNGVGKNRLGELLMRVRTEIAE